MKREERYEIILEHFRKEMPHVTTELDFGSEFQLLVAVMLSAQCTDKRVNMVTPALFDAYPTPAKMALASEENIFAFIHSVSYPNAKAKHLKGLAEKLVSDFGGEVPDNIDALQTLPGVGRKTANVVCAVIWQQPTMAVDTHIFRVSERIGLTTGSRSPLQTEKQLVKYIPESVIPKAHHWLLLHGRYVCQARKPKCDICGLKDCCRYYPLTLNS